MRTNPLTILRLGLCAFLFVVTVGCSGDKPKELLDTAEFEERQMNLPHAKQLYEDVIRLYPTLSDQQGSRDRQSSTCGTYSRSVGGRFGHQGMNAFVVR